MNNRLSNLEFPLVFITSKCIPSKRYMCLWITKNKLTAAADLYYSTDTTVHRNVFEKSRNGCYEPLSSTLIIIISFFLILLFNIILLFLFTLHSFVLSDYYQRFQYVYLYHIRIQIHIYLTRIHCEWYVCVESSLQLL